MRFHLRWKLVRALWFHKFKNKNGQRQTAKYNYVNENFRFVSFRFGSVVLILAKGLKNEQKK